MKSIIRAISLALLTGLAVSAISGCVVVPERGGYYQEGYYGHPHYWER